MSRLPIKTILIALLGLLLSIGCNWIYRFGLIRETGSGKPRQAIFSSQPSVEFDKRWLGGWPLKYYAAVESAGGARTVAYSTIRLVGNIAIWAIAICILAGLEYRAFRQSEKRIPIDDSSSGRGNESSSTENVKAFQLSDLLIVVLVLACAFSYAGGIYRTSAAHRQLKKDLFESGNSAQMSIRLPAWVISKLPLAISSWFARVDSVNLYGATTDQLRHALAVASPESLRIYGGNYDLRILDEALADPFLTILEISGRKVDEELIASIGSAKQLRFLGLSATNVTRVSLNSLGVMPSLRSMDLEHTEFTLDSTEMIPWSSTIRSLHLPRPAPGKSCVHRLEAWPSLESIKCDGPLEYRNDSPVVLVLHDLPRLTSVALDTLQVFELDLKRLPALDKIEPLRTNLLQRVVPGENVPELIWVSQLSTEDVAIELESMVQRSDSP